MRSLRCRDTSFGRSQVSGYDPHEAAGGDPGLLLTALGEPITPDGIARISPFRFATKAMVLNAAADDAAIKIAASDRAGAGVRTALGGDRLPGVIADLAGKRKHGFALERAVFLTVLHRLFVSGSDRAADCWREDYAIA